VFLNSINNAIVRYGNRRRRHPTGSMPSTGTGLFPVRILLPVPVLYISTLTLFATMTSFYLDRICGMTLTLTYCTLGSFNRFREVTPFCIQEVPSFFLLLSFMQLKHVHSRWWTRPDMTTVFIHSELLLSHRVRRGGMPRSLATIWPLHGWRTYTV